MIKFNSFKAYKDHKSGKFTIDKTIVCTLALSKFYYLKYKDKLYTVRLIRTTPKGFNFLDINTSICMMESYLYPNYDKGLHELDGLDMTRLEFNLPEKMYITDIATNKFITK
jgi:hypothetical protein